MQKLLIASTVILGIVLVGTALLFGADSWKRQPLAARAPSSPVQENGTAQSTSTWKTYSNTRFGFTFEYPPNFSADSNDELLTGPEDQGSDIVVGPPVTPESKLPEEFEVIVHDPQQHGSDNYGDSPGFWAKPLKDLIPTIWTLTSKDEPVASIVEMRLAGKNAFQLVVSKTIGWGGFGRSIDEANLWFFVDTGGVKLEIALPNSQLFREILQTLQFAQRGPLT